LEEEGDMQTQAETVRTRWIAATSWPKPKPRAPREPKWSDGDRRLLRFLETNRRRIVSVKHVAADLGVSVPRLLRDTEGQPFRLDFGRDRRGRRLTFFFALELRAWGLARSGREVA
jgi:hypothetical protein